MLDLESFTYLSRALESSIAPIVILASNRGRVPVRTSTTTPAPTSSSSLTVAEDAELYAHGIPPDLLARLLIIPTHPYNPTDIRKIISLRSRTESVTLSEAALNRISKKGEEVSLRYALQLLAPAQVLARVAKRGDAVANGAMITNGDNVETVGARIEVQDIEECEDLFLDARRSADVLAKGVVGGRNGYVA